MADNKGINEIIQKMAEFRQESGIRTPKGKKDNEELQFTEMDLVAGICSAALFGASNRNKDNFKSLLSNPDKSSYLGRIFKQLTLTDKYLKEKILKNINTPIGVTNNGAIKVHLESINQKLYSDRVPFFVSPIIQKESSKEIKIDNKDNIVGKLLLEIDKSSNLKETSEFLQSLEKIDDLQKLENITKLVDIIDKINQTPNLDAHIIQDISKFIQDLAEIDLSKDTTVTLNVSKIVDIIDLLNNIPEIKQVNLNTNIIQQFSDFISELSKIDTSQIPSLNQDSIDQLPNIDKYILYLNSISESVKKLSSIDFDSSILQQIPDIKESLLKIKELGEIEFNLDQLNNFNLNDFIDNLTRLKIDKDDISTIQENLSDLNNLFIDPKKKESFRQLFTNINDLLTGVNGSPSIIDTNKNIESLSNILNSIFYIISYDKKIRLNGLNVLLDITKPSGKIDTLFTYVENLSTKSLKLEPIRTIKEYFEAISILGEISLRKRLRILNNVKFFNTFINRHLPALIEDINKRFEGIDEVKDIPGLYGLSQLFEFISDIGEISMKNKVRLKTNLLYIRYFILNDIVDLIKEFNKTISDNLKDVEFKEINAFIDNILKLGDVEEEKLDNSEYNLQELNSILIKGKHSLVNLLNKIIENKQIFEDSTEIVDNLQSSVDSLIEFVNNLQLNNKAISDFISNGTLLRFTELPILSSIIKYIEENINPSSDVKKKFDDLFDIYMTPIALFTDNTIQLGIRVEDIREIIKGVRKEIKDIANLLNTIEILNQPYDNLDKDIFNKINNFINTIKLDNVTIDTSQAINDLSIGITNLAEFLKTINEIEIPDQEIIDNLNNFITYLENNLSGSTNLEDIIEKIVLSEEYLNKIQNTKKVFNVINDLNEDIKKIVLIGKLLGPFESVLNKEAEIINTFINKFENIDPKKIESAQNIIKELSKLIMMSTLTLIIGALAMSFVSIKNLFVFTLTLGIFVVSMAGICILISKFFGDKNLDNFLVAVEGVMQIVLTSAAVLLLGSLVMNFIDQGNLVLFAITLGGFVLLMSGVMTIMSLLDIEKLKTLSEDFGILVMILAGTLIIGSILTSFVKFENLLKFTANLTGFMIALSIPLFLYTKIKGKMVKGAKDFGELVFMCGMTLALGALITHFVTFGDLFAFAANLGLFMVMLSIPLFIMAKGGGKILMKGAKELGMLVLMSATALIIGGLFMQIDGLWKESLKFAGILGLFIGLISLAIGLGSMIAGGRGLKFGKELNQLVLISSIVLLIGGGLFMSYPELPKNVLYFGLILGGFIALVSIAFGIAGKLLRGKGIAMALALSVLIGIIAATLIIGPYYIKQYGIDYMDILKFAGITLGYVLLFGVVLGLLGLFAAQIGLGLLCTVGIGLVTLGLAWVMLESYKMMSEINWDELWEQWKNAGILFGIITGVVAILGGIMSTGIGAAVLALGAAAFATIEGLIWGMGKCIQAASIGVMYLKVIENEDVESLMIPFGDFLKYGLEAIWDNTSLKKLGYLGLVKDELKGLNEVIGSIAKSIKEYAELKVPIYDDSGQLIGYRNLTNDDFTNAAINISTIITLVGGAIMGLFGIGPMASDMNDDQKAVAMEMLKVEPGGLFRSNKTKFGLIVEASAGLGRVIKEIADGAITWNQLPEKFDANKAAMNIATIITLVGGAIMGLFGLGPMASDMTEDQKAVALEMLETTGSGFLGLGPKKTKFGLVLEATEHIGDIIKSIGEGSMAFSKLPEGFDVVKIGSNVGTIVTTLGKALMDLYNTDLGREMFKTDNIFTGNNKFKRVADSVGQLGTMISNIMEGVQSYANLKIPTKFDKEGKPIEWRPMTAIDFMLAEMNIGKIVTTLGEALTKVAESDLFKSIFGGVQLKNISEAIANVSQVVTPIAESIWMYSLGKFPILEYKDGNLVTSGYFDTKKYGGIRKVISVATNNIGLVIKGLAQKIGELLEDDSLEFLYDDAEDVKIFTESLSLLTNSINSIFKILGEIIQKPLPSGLISSFIIFPLSTFIEGALLKNKNEDLVEWLIDEYDDELEDYSKALSLLSKTIKTVFGSIKDIIDMNLTNEQVSQIPTMLSSYLSLSDSIKGFSIQYTKETSESINRYIEDLKKIVELAKTTKEEYAERYNILRDGINAIYSATSVMIDNDVFSSHTDTLEKYVQAVNSIDLSKVHSLTNLAEAVTELGNKIGNIDNFTNVLATKIATVLTKLTSQIKEAEKVIKDADKLHKKREELIKRSVGEVTKLMQQDMTVTIKKEEEPTENPGGITNTPSTGDQENGNINVENSGSGSQSSQNTTSGSNNTNNGNRRNSSSIPNSTLDIIDNRLQEIDSYLHKKLK